MQAISTLETYKTIDELKIIRTLGEGYHSIVRLAEDEFGTQYAVKQYNPKTICLNTFEKEANISSSLTHENLVKFIDKRPNALMTKSNNQTFQCLAIVLEYIEGPQLFELVTKTGKFSQKLSRTYFYQLLSGIKYMHDMGYVHRDIKLQNILIGKDYKLKLGDFGCSYQIQSKQNLTNPSDQICKTSECQARLRNQTFADIFSAAIVLFFMCVGKLPFQKSCKNSCGYINIINEKYHSFWREHQKSLSSCFKDLFMKMITKDPKKAITINQIFDHPWMKDQKCSLNQIKLQINEKLKIINLKKYQSFYRQTSITPEGKKNPHINTLAVIQFITTIICYLISTLCIMFDTVDKMHRRCRVKKITQFICPSAGLKTQPRVQKLSNLSFSDSK